MKVISLGNNQIEIRLSDKSMLVSYETPVAAHINGQGWFRTASHFSRTTNKHISSWIVKGVEVKVMPQSWFEELLESVK